MRGFEGEAIRIRWRRASGLVVALLLVACNGTTRQLPLEAPSESAGVVAVIEAEGTPLSDAALIERGEVIYRSNCAPCHQPNGEGTLSTFPALNRNAFVTVSDPTGVIDTVLHGRQIMPAFEVMLSDQEVAAVISYIRNAWDNQASVVNEAQVSEVQSGAAQE